MIVDLQQNTPEWLEWRRGKIGASDSGTILGINPWETAYTLWQRKLGLIPEKEKTLAMKRGIDNEGRARHEFEEVSFVSITPKVFCSEKYPFIIASLDGISIDKKIVLEIKCLNEDLHSRAKKGYIPDYYISQMQQQMYCSGAIQAIYYCCDKEGKNGVSQSIFRNEKEINYIVEKEVEFYKCMKEFIPPPMTEKDFQKKNDHEFLEVCERYRNVKRELLQLENCEKELRETLVKATCGQNTIGGGLKISKSVRKGAVDYKIIPELIGVDLEIFRSDPVVSWRITESKE